MLESQSYLIIETTSKRPLSVLEIYWASDVLMMIEGHIEKAEGHIQSNFENTV